jgi:ribosomal protein L7/L12
MKIRIGKFNIEMILKFKITKEKPFISKIKQLLSEGKKLTAIKLYKDETNSNLKESKEFVDNLLNSDLDLNKQYHEL